MKIPAGKKAAHAAERTAFQELHAVHRYMVFDSLPARDRDADMFRAIGKRMTHTPAVAIKLAVPRTSWLGRQILELRKQRDPRTSKSAKARAKAHKKASAE